MHVASTFTVSNLQNIHSQADALFCFHHLCRPLCKIVIQIHSLSSRLYVANHTCSREKITICSCFLLLSVYIAICAWLNNEFNIKYFTSESWFCI